MVRNTFRTTVLIEHHRFDLLPFTGDDLAFEGLHLLNRICELVSCNNVYLKRKVKCIGLFYCMGITF